MHEGFDSNPDNPEHEKTSPQPGENRLRGVIGMLGDLRHTTGILMSDGLGPAGRRVMNTLRFRLYADPGDRRWEDRFRVSAGHPVPLDSLTIVSDHRHFGVEYVPTPVRVFTDLIEAAEVKPSDYSFIDFGSGKGRLLARAAELGFRRVYGIEFARELHEATERNVAAFMAATGTRPAIEAIHGDAAAFRIPDGPCVLYLFNPFTAPVLEQILGNVRDSFLRSPRHIVVIYRNPTDHRLLARASFLRPMRLRLRDRLRGAVLHTEAVRFYETDPCSVTGAR